MVLKFDVNRNLQQDYIVNFRELIKHLGFSEQRKFLLANLLNYLKLFHSFGCVNVYIVGSFTTNKKDPGDIDICVDINQMRYYEFEKNNPDMVVPKGIYKILDKEFIHIVTYFDNYTIESLNWFRNDKKDNKRGIIKLILNDIESYD